MEGSKIKPIKGVGEKTKEIKEALEKEGKVSYEQLTDIANQLHQQLQRVQQENMMLKNDYTLTRMEFLFKVIKQPTVFSDRVFSKSVKEIEDVLFPLSPEEEEDADLEQFKEE